MSKYTLYSGDYEVEFHEPYVNGRKLHYYTVNGIKVRSVTTILGFIDKSEGLLPWAAGCAVDAFHQRCMDNIRNIDEPFLNQLAKECRFAYKQESQKAADIGTLVHEWVESYIKNQIDSTYPVLEYPVSEQANTAIEKFLEFEGTYIHKYLASERLVYSRNYNYVGTLDILAETQDGMTSVIDIKTSKRIYPEYYMQVGAYISAFTEEFPDHPVYGYIMRLGKEGDFEIKYMSDAVYQMAIKAFISTARAKTDHVNFKEILTNG